MVLLGRISKGKGWLRRAGRRRGSGQEMEVGEEDEAGSFIILGVRVLGSMDYILRRTEEGRRGEVSWRLRLLRVKEAML